MIPLAVASLKEIGIFIGAIAGLIAAVGSMVSSFEGLDIKHKVEKDDDAGG